MTRPRRIWLSSWRQASGVSGDQYFAKLQANQVGRRNHRRRRPEEISQALRRFDGDRRDVGQRQPGVLTRDEQLEPGTDARIGIGER